MASSSSLHIAGSNHPVDLSVPKLSEVLSLLNIPLESVVNVYPYGSHLFGVARPDSGAFDSSRFFFGCYAGFSGVFYLSLVLLSMCGIEFSACCLNLLRILRNFLY